VETITSQHNPLLKDIRRAASRGELTQSGYAIADGFHLLDEALKSGIEIGTVIASESVAETFRERPGIRTISVPDNLFNGLSSTETPQGILSLVRLKHWSLEHLVTMPSPTILVLDQLQDPGNAGAAVRASEAFGATGVIFLKGSVQAHNPKCLRGSAGSIFRLPLAERIEPEALVDVLNTHGIPLYAADPYAQRSIESQSLSSPCAIAVGSEGRGISRHITSHATALRIPTTNVESLNAAVAAAVMLYEARRQRSAA
jgi:RNA methyltransferase, TrmH family